MPVMFVGSCPYVVDMCKQTYAHDMTPAYVAEMEMRAERGRREARVHFSVLRSTWDRVIL